MSLDLKVIGAGLGRTGTTSLEIALDIPVPSQPFPHENKRSEYHGY